MAHYNMNFVNKIFIKEHNFFHRCAWMNKRFNKQFFVAVLISIFFMVIMGCKSKAPEATTAKTTQDTLQAFVIKQQTVSKIISLPSQLESFEKADLFAKIQGYVRKMNVDIGDRVKAGQVLAVIEAAEYNANLSQSVASAQSAKAKFQSSKDAYERLLNAAKEPGAIAEVELVRAQNQVMADSAAYDAAKQTSNAYSQLNNYLIIKAPFNGVITQRNADPGDLVSSGNKEPLLIVENNLQLRLKVPVPETYTDAATEAKNINFTVDAMPDKNFSANLYRKSNTIDLANRTELWEFLVKNDGGFLTSGMYANVKLPIARKNPSLVVLYPAVATTLEKKFVIRYENGQAKWVDVRNGINMDSTVEVFGDIKPGDTLLVKATDEVKNGSNIVIKL
jgi:membrane fusion protein, multidrug efflux system